jgi:hypothetical protein
MYSRSTLTRAAGLVVIAGALGAAVGVGSASPATGSKPKFKITSSLDGKTVLPHHVQWLAFPHPANATVREVAFLIDGKVRWIETNPPYSYSDDGGYLVTSWLAPGRHRFTVRATSTSGKRAIHTVVASTVEAPEPPADLAGSWQRDVSTEVPGGQDCGGSDPVPAGRWTLVFERRWIESHYPGTFDPATSPQTGAGNILLDDYVPDSSTFTVFGAVTTGLFNLKVAAGGGWWCNPGGPSATYTWSVSGDTLTLQPVGGVDKNSQRGAIYAGTWKRVG